MAKEKNKFGWEDVAELTGHAATMVGYYKDAQAAAKKSFDDGNKTNLKGSEGGASKPKLGTKDSGMSSLAREYNRKHFMQ